MDSTNFISYPYKNIYLGNLCQFMLYTWGVQKWEWGVKGENGWSER
jgi:hypothetical protein